MRRLIGRFRSISRPSSLLLLLLFAVAAAGAACNRRDGDGDATATATATARAAATAVATEAPAPLPVVEYPLTITDTSGAEVVIEAAPQRIISYSPGATEMLFAIGAGARVVATDTASDFPAEAQALPKLDAFTADPEAALAQEPDLVLFSFQSEQLEQFRDLGMTVMLVEPPQTIDGIYEQILLFSELTGTEREARALVASMRERVESVRQAIADVDEGPRVFFELDASLFTVNTDTFIGGMLRLLKTQNVANGAPSQFPQLSAEAVIEADPQVVFLADAASFGYGDESAESVAARPGWEAVSAVVNEHVYDFNPDIVSRPGPRIVEGLEAMARALYPERFP